MTRDNLIYMPEETTPTIATEGNRKAVAYLELSDDDDNHDYYGRLFAASPKTFAGLKELLEIVEDWIAEDFVHPYHEDDGETPDTFLAPYRKLICATEGTLYAVVLPSIGRKAKMHDPGLEPGSRAQQPAMNEVADEAE